MSTTDPTLVAGQPPIENVPRPHMLPQSILGTAHTERDERLRDARKRADRARVRLVAGRSGLAASIDDFLALDDEVTRLDAVVTAVRKICAEHWDYQARRGAKFGRKGSDCLCEICQVVRVLDGGAS